MDLINIKTDAIEISATQRQRRGFYVCSTTLSAFNERVNSIIFEFQTQGFTLFKLEFTSRADDEDDEPLPPRCTVVASRMETPEETDERVTRQKRYNQSQIDEHSKKLENSKRAKEIRRLTEHLTLEQLQALRSIS